METGLGRSPWDVTNNAESFSEISSLCIRDCPQLKFLPMLPPLVKLTLVNVSEKLFRHPCNLLHHLPEYWLLGLTKLEKLHIGSCPSLASLSWGMWHLRNLESLSIYNCKEFDLSKDEQGNVMMELQGLNSLKLLMIYKASKLEYLIEWLSHAYTLRFLCIRSCPNLAGLPQWIEYHQSLKLLELVHYPRLTSLPVGMYDFTKNYHRKLSIVGCPHLQKSKWIKYSRRL